MTEYRPLDARGVPDPRLDGLHEGVPAWLATPLSRILQEGFGFRDSGTKRWRPWQEKIDTYELKARRKIKVSRGESTYQAIVRLPWTDASQALVAIDFLLHHPTPHTRVTKETERVLKDGGSVWTVTRVPEGNVSELTRRELTGTRDAIERTPAGKARDHLLAALSEVARREPDPSGAYDHAVKAVEAAARPVISPRNDKATLGTILRDMRAKPEKWTTTLGQLDHIIAMADALWRGHDRHGTPDDGPIEQSVEEAEAAVNLAVPLVHAFVTGGVSAVR